MPKLREDEPTFHKYAWWFPFKYLAPQYIKDGDGLMVVAASLGTRKKRAEFKGAVESVVRQCTDVKVPRQVAFWTVEANPCLQAADYSVWAVSRYWERSDDRARAQLGTKLPQSGTTSSRVRRTATRPKSKGNKTASAKGEARHH